MGSEPTAVRIFPTQSMFPHAAGQGQVTLVAPESFEWVASASASWIHLRPPTRGLGGHTLEYQVERNPDAARHATIALAGQRLTVLQRSPPVWQERQVLKAPLAIIEQVGLQGFIEQIQKQPPEAQPALYAALLETVSGAAKGVRALYAASPEVPQHYTSRFIDHERALLLRFIQEHMTPGGDET